MHRRPTHQVSSRGRIRILSAGGVWRYKWGTAQTSGYLRVHYAGRLRFVHALVCRAFHGPRPSPSHTTHHIDHVRNNNRASNLKWADPSEQQRESRRVNTSRKSNSAKVSKAVFSRPVGGQRADGDGPGAWTRHSSLTLASSSLGMSVSSVSDACRNGAPRCGHEFVRAHDTPCTTLMDGERVRRVHGRDVTDLGRVRLDNGNFHHGYLRADGYFGVSTPQAPIRQSCVHRLVCLAFHGPPPSDQHTTVHHIDGDPRNNLPSNLCWATPSEQVHHSWTDNSARSTNADLLNVPVRCRPLGETAWVTYRSQGLAARAVGLSHTSGISACIRKLQAHTAGYEFEEAPEQAGSAADATYGSSASKSSSDHSIDEGCDEPDCDEPDCDEESDEEWKDVILPDE